MKKTTHRLLLLVLAAAALAGNPGAAGPFILRLKLPASYTIAPHRHSIYERVTVISGAVNMGAGEELDRAAGQTRPPTGFVNVPTGMAQFAWVQAETTLQINGNGPFDVIYAVDDPRQQQQSSKSK